MTIFFSLSVDFRAYSKKKTFYHRQKQTAKKGIYFRRTQENTFLVHKSSVVLFGEKCCRCFFYLWDVHGSPLHFPSSWNTFAGVKQSWWCGSQSVETEWTAREGELLVALCCFVKTKKNKVIFGVHISGALKKKRFFEMKRDIWLKRKWCFYLYGKRNENKSSAKKMSEICHVK